MSSELVVTLAMRKEVMAPATMSAFPVSTRCDKMEHTVRLQPPPERGHYCASQRMAGPAAAGARGKLGAVHHQPRSTELPLTATHLPLPPRCCRGAKVSIIRRCCHSISFRDVHREGPLQPGIAAGVQGGLPLRERS